MAKREQMYRLMHITNFLKSKIQGASYEEVRNYLEEKYYQDSFDGELAFSEKTFKRDRNLLEELFGIEIGFKRSTMTYQVLEDGFSDSSQTVFDNLLLVNAYKQTANHSNIMFFEKRQASGLHHLEGIIYAIKNSKLISFQYTKHWEGVPHKKVTEPYAVKEFRNRWYLLANERDGKDFFLKTFGLDRISDLDISKSTFTRQNVNIEDMFVNSFGIISTLNADPQKIILSFDYEQGKFVKSLPIHHSQKILVDNSDEYRIELTLAPTYDFYQELLSHAGRMKILEPENVKAEYLKILKHGIALSEA